MKSGRALLILSVLLGSVGCDQGTKIVARQHLDGLGTLSYLGDTIRLSYVENYGAFLGMGSSLPAYVRTLIFTGAVSVMLVGFLIWLIRSKELSRWSVVAAGLIIGGGIGNLIDRILYDGGVTDFLNLGIGALRTGVFNVADVSIMAGAFLLIFSPDMRREFQRSIEGDDDQEHQIDQTSG